MKAGVSGTVQQFTLRAGEVVNPLLRPAGILVPETAGRTALIAGFGQIEAQVMKPGMIAEATCIGKPFTIIPMVVTEVQDVIAGGQVRASDQLVDIQQLAKPGTITVTPSLFTKDNLQAFLRAAVVLPMHTRAIMKNCNPGKPVPCGPYSCMP